MVLQPERPTSIAAIRQHMLSQLPDYMVPPFYVELPQLPLNLNMKVDRQALPPLQESDRRAAATMQIRAPQTATETELAEIWKRLLRIGRVGLDDNFFELGGYSLLAAELILQAERRLGARLEGIEILRESLEIVASLVDARAGNPLKARGEHDADPNANPTFTCDYFGSERSLWSFPWQWLGALNAGAVDLLSIGKEDLRCHFVLRKLASQLGSRGVPVLRFNYFGCGDSRGDDINATCGRWRKDIVEAFHELGRRAPAATIQVLGVRLGATLAWSVRSQLCVERLILWDPVNGREYLAEMHAMHRALVLDLKQLRAGRPPRRLKDAEELLGFTWSNAALEELRHLQITPASLNSECPVDWLASEPDIEQRRWFTEIAASITGSRFESVPYRCRWADARAAGGILSGRRCQSGHHASVGNPTHMNEFACQFGPGGRLAGIVTESAQGSGKKGCILVSAGLVPKFGPYRLYTLLSRSLAQAGVYTLRFDLGGIGDSERGTGSLPLAMRASLEIAAAVRAVLWPLRAQRYHALWFVLGGGRLVPLRAKG